MNQTKAQRAAELGAILVNGRTRFYSRISSFKALGDGKYEAVRNGVVYQIEGGRRAGGSARDWFIDSEGWAKSIVCTSLVDALNLIDGMCKDES